jgi:HEAT repeat protein
MVLLFCLLAAVPAFAQELTGGFHPEESTYLLGEPVWFVFEVKNEGTVPVYIEYSNPYGVCAFVGGYSFDVPDAMPRWRCGYVASCAGGGAMPLPAGATYAQRLLLNQWLVIDQPGAYHVFAKRNLHHSLLTESPGVLLAPGSSTFSSEFDVTIVKGEEAKVEKVFGPYLKNLNLKDLSRTDFDRRIEAVETITAMAPPFLEKTLIALATGADSFDQSRAIPALGRLNTAESRQALAKLIEDRQEYDSWQAIDALAETGDRTYVPLLEELAREPKWQNSAIPALGELGGREVIPLLVPFIHYPLGPPNEPPVQALAIRGFANTRSREAMPYLIQALRTPLVHRDAVNALEQLTHLVIREKNSQHWLYAQDDQTADRMADRWQRWWKSTGENAELYGPGDCTTSPEQLPEQ